MYLKCASSLFQFRGAYRRLIGRDAALLQHVPTSNVVPQFEDEEIDLDVPSDISLPTDQFTNSIITYIAGFVARKLYCKVKCELCRNYLVSPKSHPKTEFLGLISLKDRGGLIVPSEGVVSVCQSTETVIRQLTEKELASSKLASRIKIAVMEICTVPFPDDHESGLDSHAVQLLK